MSSTRGNPRITIRLEPPVAEQLRQRAEEASPGGGVAYFIRTLIHRELGLPEPAPYAPHPSPRKRQEKVPAPVAAPATPAADESLGYCPQCGAEYERDERPSCPGGVACPDCGYNPLLGF